MSPAIARPAATVIVLRPATEGAPELLLVRRSRRASFMADAFVFPGGRVDDADVEASGADILAAASVAAARELGEEADVRVDPRALLAWSRWVTPSAEPKRFDALFFVVAVPSGTEARVDDSEVTEHLWITAAGALRSQRAGEIKLPPPTLRTLEELVPHTTTEAVLREVPKRSLQPIQPKLVGSDDSMLIVLPWDPEFAALPGAGDIIPDDSVLAGGVSRYAYENGRFVPNVAFEI